MRRAFLFLLLPLAVPRAQAQTAAAAAREAPHIIMPGAPLGQGAGPALFMPAAPGPILSAAPSGLIIPAAPVISAPAPMIVAAARAMTELEAAPDKAPTVEQMQALAKSLAPAGAGEDEGAAAAGRARALDASFDGKLAPEASAWESVSADFAKGPLTPGLPAVETAARSLIARLLPALYRRVPVTAVYDRKENPATGHTWTPETGHVFEIAPVRADSRGEVPSSFGAPGRARVQQKIEQLMEFAHEYFHAIFDAAVRRTENHPPHSVYSAMTEGFAVSGEQLLADRLLDFVPALGLPPRDAGDLAAVGRARREWLDVEDNHYSEGIVAWRKAYERGGTTGLLEFLSSLSARRMSALPRSDSAYQLALGDPKLLSAYLGRDADLPLRRGLDAYAKAARGEKTSQGETLLASAAVAEAGADGWRRVFERTLLADKRLKEPKTAAPKSGAWWEKEAAPAVPVEPAFALARLSPAAGAALSRFLAETLAASGGAQRLFERPGPNEKLAAILTGAEALPWDENDRRLWNDGLNRWLLGAR